MQANCHIVAADQGRACVIIDPGMSAAPFIDRVIKDHHLTPAGILLTHGHTDHVADVAPVADRYAIPAWIRSEDRPFITDPVAGLGPELGKLVAAVLRRKLDEPKRLELLDDRNVLQLADLTFQVAHAPGHTPGSVMYVLDQRDNGDTLEDASLVFTGDVLFAGSIGRTDLPGGDPHVLASTLRGPVADLEAAAVIRPGHGQASTMAVERAHNPYLRAEFLQKW
jgi:glyoxylase-like metal-dependent hydrolase (beta-lactamase superfamily II)